MSSGRATRNTPSTSLQSKANQSHTHTTCPLPHYTNSQAPHQPATTMLASAASVFVLGSLLSLVAAAPYRTPILSFDRTLARRTSPSDTVLVSHSEPMAAACAPQCAELKTVLDQCYDQASCTTACAPGNFDRMAQCLNCNVAAHDATGMTPAEVATLQAKANVNLGVYLELCTFFHYSPLSQIDIAMPLVTATPTGTAKPQLTTMVLESLTSLKPDATLTVTPAAIPTA